MTCEEVRLALGAHALGALEPDEALEIDTHLATCEVCGAELLELEGVASFLGKVSERDVELVASPPRQVLDRLLNARAKRSRRGRLLLVAAASAAVLGLGGTVWAVIQESSPPQHTAASAPATTPSPAQEAQEAGPNTLKLEDDHQSAPAEKRPKATPVKPSQSASEAPRMALAGREFEGENRAKDYSATVMAWPRDDGTELGVGVRGVPDGTTCRLVVIGKNGQRDVTESWVISSRPYEDQSAFKSTTDLALKDIARIDVVDQTGKVLVKVPARK